MYQLLQGKKRAASSIGSGPTPKRSVTLAPKMTPEYIVKEKARLQALELQYADMIQQFKASQAWKNVTTPVRTEDVRIVALKTPPPPSHIVTEENMTFSCGSDSEKDATVAPKFSLISAVQGTRTDLTPPWSGASSNCNSPVRNRPVITTKELPPSNCDSPARNRPVITAKELSSAVSNCNSPLRNRPVIASKELPSASGNAPAIVGVGSNSPMRNRPVITTKELPSAHSNCNSPVRNTLGINPKLNCDSPMRNRPVITTKDLPPAPSNCNSPARNRPVITTKDLPPAASNCNSPVRNTTVITTKKHPPATSNVVAAICSSRSQAVDKNVDPGAKTLGVADKPAADGVKTKTKLTYKFSMPKGQQLDNLKRLHVSDCNLIGEFQLVLASMFSRTMTAIVCLKFIHVVLLFFYPAPPSLPPHTIFADRPC